jgi:DNA-binding CsgD family transcriptional regulator
MTDEQKKKAARELREQGKTLAYISRCLGISLPTVDLWTKDIYQEQQRSKSEAAKHLAREGVGARQIARRLGVDISFVRREAGTESAGYKARLQAEVKRLASQGYSAATIAASLNISERTVYAWARKELILAKRQKDARRRRGGND